jgi:asparagine synthase (glutamine-hydrolysing)
MCGIIGSASSYSRSEHDHSWIVAGRDSMLHRGPDGKGSWCSPDSRVALGHRRLAIIDLSLAGHQPMQLAKSGYAIVFNGEIYNYQELRRELTQLGYSFASHSDTEVLLTAYDAWGVECLNRLNGMFAFALFDAQNERLFLARDRAGEKPLFYFLDGASKFYFASELKALLSNKSLPRKIDPLALDCYLSMGYVPGERCILAGYNKLPAAHAMTFSLRDGSTKIWRYWTLPELDPNAHRFETEELMEELSDLLEDAVGKQLIADVPVGVLLSGGVDSSLITAMTVRRSSQVRTFSISFPGHGKHDESAHARLIAKHFGTVHTELVAEPTTADIIPRLAAQFDEPIIDSSMIPTWLVTHLVRQHCTVALGGDGGDELFGGYGHHSRLLLFAAKARWIPLSIRRGIAASATKVLPTGFKGRNWLQALGSDLNRNLPLVANYFDRPTRRSLLSSDIAANGSAEEIFAQRIPANVDLLQRVTRMDFQNYMVEDILVKVDRASMLNSLEMRAPLLDYRIIEFAFRKVPSRLKSDGVGRKILLKKLCEQVLPPQFDKHRKQGFGIPMSEWLKTGPFRELFWDTLQQPDCVFNPQRVASLLDGQDRGHGNGERLFGLVLFELWRRHYAISL